MGSTRRFTETSLISGHYQPSIAQLLLKPHREIGGRQATGMITAISNKNVTAKYM